MSAMDCPRCKSAMRVAHKSCHYGTTVEVDVCDGCGGKWVDGGKIERFYPALAQHRVRIEELVAVGAKRGRGLAFCPRCGGENIVFPYLDHWLDLCGACHGMWVDRHEIALLAAHGHLTDGVAEARQAAQGPELLMCAKCAQPVAKSSTMVTEYGAVCNRCHAGNATSTSSDSSDTSGFDGAAVAVGLLGVLFELLLEVAIDA